MNDGNWIKKQEISNEMQSFLDAIPVLESPSKRILGNPFSRSAENVFSDLKSRLEEVEARNE